MRTPLSRLSEALRSQRFTLVVLALVTAFTAVNACATGGASKQEAMTWLDDGAQLLDVRTVEEFAAGHLPGALNIPVQALDVRMGELGARDGKWVVYCRSGRRSARALEMMRAAGYTDVLDVGPMSACDGCAARPAP